MSIQVNNKNLGHATAYAYAVAGGYTGTEAEFTELLGNIADDLEQIENLTVTVETLAAGSSATASYSNGVLHLGIPKGDKGDKGDTGATGPTGPTGNGIASVAKTGTSGLVDTYTITYTNGNTSTFTVTNGAEAVDNTLTIAGRAADAKKTGDEISELKEDLNATNAEVTDIRVGADGTTYNSAGAAVRGQISDLKKDLALITGTTEITLTEGLYISTAGAVGDTASLTEVSSQLWRSAIVNCSAGEGFLVNVKGGATPRAWCFVDSSNKILSISASSITVTNTVILAPKNSAKLILNDNIAYLGTNYRNVIRAVNNRVDILDSKTETLRSNINPTGIELTANRYINCTTGGVGANYNYSYATEDYIAVSPLSTIDLTDYANTTHSIESAVGLAFYSDDNTYISGISYAGNTSGIHATVPANATKMRITIFNNSVNSFMLRIDTTPSVKNLYFPIASNPLDVIKESAGLTAVFRTVGCIGDSLASGESAYKTDGVTHYVDLYDFSWGQCLARMTGNTYYNFSAGGLSAKTWLTSQYCTTAFDGNHKCDAYIIGLGQNDKNQGYTVGTTADIDLSDYTQNADTFCGNYGKIIQMIQEHQPKAKIFVMTDMLEAVNTYGINAAIRSVAELFDNVYVLDFYQYGANYVKSGFLYNQYRSGHFNAIGYQYIAWMIATYIDWYIKNHQSEFAQVEFIGTDYAW